MTETLEHCTDRRFRCKDLPPSIIVDDVLPVVYAIMSTFNQTVASIVVAIGATDACCIHNRNVIALKPIPASHVRHEQNLPNSSRIQKMTCAKSAKQVRFSVYVMGCHEVSWCFDHFVRSFWFGTVFFDQ